MYKRTNYLASTIPEVRAYPQVQYIEWPMPNNANYLPELVVSIDCSYPRNLIKKMPRYTIYIIYEYHLFFSISVPKRVVTLDVSKSNVSCINNTWHRSNNKKRQTRLPMTILQLNVAATHVYRFPEGFFTSLVIGNSYFYVTPNKNRESIIEVYLWSITRLKFINVRKSVRSLLIHDHSVTHSLDRKKLLDKSVYNLRYTYGNRRPFWG